MNCYKEATKNILEMQVEENQGNVHFFAKMDMPLTGREMDNISCKKKGKWSFFGLDFLMKTTVD